MVEGIMLTVLQGLLALIVVVCLLVVWRFVSWKFSCLHEIPGPIKDLNFSSWVFGVFATIEKEDFMAPQQKWWNEAGAETQLLHYSGLFGKHFVIVLDADGVKKVLTSPSHNDEPLYPKGFEYLRRILGNGLVTLDGSSWHRHRRIIQPAFGNINKALDDCVPGLVDSLIKCWKANPNIEIDVSSHMCAITLDIIGKVAFSHEFHAMQSIEKWSRNPNCDIELTDPLIMGVHASLMPSMTRMVLMNFRLSFLERFFLPKIYDAGVIFDHATDEVVKHAELQSQIKGEATSLLEYLCKPTSHGMLSQMELRNEVKTFLIAGHETTSTLCTWAIYCLTKYPRVHKLVFEEIKTQASEGIIGINSVDDMPYLEAFLNEVLRLYPPVGLTTREASKNTTLLGEKIPAGTKIVIPTYLLHRCPKYWTDPLEFKPERWLKSTENEPKFHRFAFVPFSAGGRSCIGQQFSMYEAKLILAPLIYEFDFLLAPSLEGKEIKVQSFVTTRSDPAIKIQAIQRQ